MTFRLEDLLKSPCQNLWHALISAGELINGDLVVPNELAGPILASCQDPPPVAVSVQATFAACLRTEAEKKPLRRICQACEFGADGQCSGSTCCSGRVPIEVRLNLSTTVCPKSRWPA